MILPQRALVRPRVVAPESGEVLLLEDEVLRWLERGQPGAIAVLGRHGAGKTSALAHLAAVLPSDAIFGIYDNDIPHPELLVEAYDRIIVYADTVPRPRTHLAVYPLARWSNDDLIEYLLNAHRDQCTSVMRRLPPAEQSLLRGIPQLWRIVLDHLAGDCSLSDIRAALHRCLANFLHDTDMVERSRSGCLTALARGGGLHMAPEFWVKPGFPPEVLSVLHHEPVQIILAAERIAADMHAANDCDYLAKRLPRELICASAELIRRDSRARAHLNQLLDGENWSHAMAASLLLACDPDWRPPRIRNLNGGYFSDAQWANIHLPYAQLNKADLSGANLSGANLTRTSAVETDYHNAWLHGAMLAKLRACRSDFTEADLSSMHAKQANFEGAVFTRANLDDAKLESARLSGANLTRATLRRADLSRAELTNALIEGADFSSARLFGAECIGLRLRLARWRGAALTQANLTGCDLEYMELPGANFAAANLTNALLTGTVMPRANFTRATLCNAGLADVDWEGACLVNADLTGASFHLGSTRSGLVGSPIASEGSRTGFYTDDFEEQTYKAPEEIRKANLCGADLRGAKVENVDFYLVDLRGATYDAEQALHFRRSGAILKGRT